jgi:hypothetical protein
MSELYYTWMCTNRECKSINKEKKESIDKIISQGKDLNIFCQICGFAPMSNRLPLQDRSGKATNSGSCITFTGEESRLPLGRTPDGFYRDVNGDKVEAEKFYKMGIDPDIYLNWVRNGKPRGK